MREGEDSSSFARYAIIPSSGTFEESPTEAKAWIGVANVQLVLTKLSGKPIRHIGLQHVGVPLLKHQVPGPDVYSPLEDAGG